MADILITIPDSLLDKIRNTSIRTGSISVALENAVQKGMVLPEGVMPLIIFAIKKHESISKMASATGTSFEKVAFELERLERELTNYYCLEDLKDSVIKERSEIPFHCGFEESGGHAYNCNDCPNKCEEYYQWDKEIKMEDNNGIHET